MPLMQSKSKKAFSKNVEIEMEHGKPQDQSLAIAYSVKRKNSRKKMAEGGGVSSAKHQQRPMPEQKFNDSKDVSQNSSKKSLPQDKWTDQPTLKQAQNKPKVQPISHPRMVPSNAFSARLYDKEGHLLERAKPGPYNEQPEQDMNELEAKKKGPSSKDLSLKMMAIGGEVENDADHQALKHNKSVDSEYGGGAEQDMAPSPEGLESDNDEMSPSEDEFMSGKMKMLANGGNLEDAPKSKINYVSRPDSGFGAVIMKAEGGDVDLDEMENEKHSSIAAAIMAKKDRMNGFSGSEDEEAAMHGLLPMDEMKHKKQMLAGGGEVDIESNGAEEPNDYYHQNEDVVLKENYDHLGEKQPLDSNEHDVAIAKDAHDMVDKIMNKMKARKQFVKP